MKKTNTVKKKEEFNEIISIGKVLKNDFFVVYYKSNQLDKFRFGISVGKKLGNAVFRNKYKRKIRSIIDNNKKYYQNGMDYIIIMRKACINGDFSIMNDKYVQLIEKIKIEEK